MRVEVYFHAGESLPAFVVEGEIAEKLQLDARKIAEAQYPNGKILSVDTGR